MHAIATQTNPPWGLDRIDQRNLPLSGTYTYNWTGSGGRASNVYDAFGGNGSPNRLLYSLFF